MDLGRKGQAIIEYLVIIAVVVAAVVAARPNLRGSFDTLYRNTTTLVTRAANCLNLPPGSSRANCP